jgi:hypothetical protein
MTSVAGIFQAWSTFSKIEVVSSSLRLTERIVHLVIQHFALLGNICLLGYGFKELVIDKKKPLQDQKAEKISNIFYAAWQKMTTRESFPFIHGTLLLGSGSTGVAAALHSHAYLPMGMAYGSLALTSAGLWFLVNLYGLQYQVKNYRIAESLPPSDEALQQKRSAILGMLNHLSYILSSGALSLTEFGGLSPALILGTVGISTGCTKILYDYFYSIK